MILDNGPLKITPLMELQSDDFKVIELESRVEQLEKDLKRYQD